MSLFTGLFGGSENTIITVVLALGVVLVLIVLGLWALKLLFNATGKVGRGRNRRLSVIDSAPIDSKRQLVLVRRDDVEHLVIVGGSHEVVVETGITPPAEPATARRPRRRGAPAPAQQPVRGEPDAAAAAVAAATRTKEPDLGTPAAGDDSAEPGSASRPTSLRHTGLMRQQQRVEPELHPQPSAPDSNNDAASEADSARKSAQTADTAPEEPVIDTADDRTSGDESADTRKTESEAGA